jgi:hypothetical protein
MRPGGGYANDHARRRKSETSGEIYFRGADRRWQEINPQADSRGFPEVQFVSKRRRRTGQLLQREVNLLVLGEEAMAKPNGTLFDVQGFGFPQGLKQGPGYSKKDPENCKYAKTPYEQRHPWAFLVCVLKSHGNGDYAQKNQISWYQGGEN